MTNMRMMTCPTDDHLAQLTTLIDDQLSQWPVVIRRCRWCSSDWRISMHWGEGLDSRLPFREGEGDFQVQWTTAAVDQRMNNKSGNKLSKPEVDSHWLVLRRTL